MAPVRRYRYRVASWICHHSWLWILFFSLALERRALFVASWIIGRVRRRLLGALHRGARLHDVNWFVRPFDPAGVPPCPHLGLALILINVCAA
jgi:hypothetical protein